MAEPIILTIGHSTRPLQDFVALLAVHRVGRLADIRTIPKSRRHPQFSIERLRDSLPEAGVAYRHLPGLGGLRKAKRDSRNTAWRHEGFRGYADYMETDAFAGALDELITWARAAPDESRTAIMCAEALWWRCHRRLVADALVVRGIEVRHIMSAAGPAPHELTEFARVDGQRVSYPGLL
jgi:uncharacterized protein (DUF488 family)